MRQAVKFGLFYLPSFYPKVKREPQFCVIMGTPEQVLVRVHVASPSPFAPLGTNGLGQGSAETAPSSSPARSRTHCRRWGYASLSFG